MIKNWTVNTKQVKKGSKGLENHINYMKDENRPSHVNTKIIVLHDSSKNIFQAIEDRTKYRQKEGLRGGGVRNYATSFVLSLPRSIKQPTKDDWKAIAKLVIKDICKINKLPSKEFSKLCNVIIHDESQGNKNSHLNLCVSNVFNNEVIKGISQYRTTHGVKMAFNNAVKEVLGEDNYKYIPQHEKVGKVPLWKAREDKAKRLRLRAKNDIKIIRKSKSKFEEIQNKTIKLKIALNDWFNKVVYNKTAQKEAVKSAVILDELDYKTPKKVLEVEENRKVEEKSKVSTNRKRRRRSTK